MCIEITLQVSSFRSFHGLKTRKNY